MGQFALPPFRQCALLYLLYSLVCLFLVGDVLLSLWVSCFSTIPAFSRLLCLVAEVLQNRKPTIKSFIFGFRRLYGRSVMLGSLGILSLL